MKTATAKIGTKSMEVFQKEKNNISKKAKVFRKRKICMY